MFVHLRHVDRQGRSQVFPGVAEPSPGFLGLLLLERPYNPPPKIAQFLGLDLLASLNRPVDQQQ